MKITCYIATSLDGCIADNKGKVDWLESFGSDEYGYDNFLKSVDGLIMGSKTYIQILGFGAWPYTEKPTFVFSHQQLETPDKANINFVENSPKEFTKNHSSKHFWLVGGSKLITSFEKVSLIDEYHIFTMPMFLDHGIPLFTKPLSRKLDRLDTTSYSNGVIRSIYKRDDKEQQ